VNRALLLVPVLAVVPCTAQAQTLLDQEERLIDIHSLLLDLPPLQAPGALEAGRFSLALEAVTIPTIDGTTGSKRQITASDRTRVFPRPRVAMGLRLPAGLRAFVGAAYVPPVRVREVATHHLALEAGAAWTQGRLRAGVRIHGAYARSTSPVTEPETRDTLWTRVGGADLSAGLAFEPVAGYALQPYAGAGVVALRGRFRVTSDGYVLRSHHSGAALHAGLRLAVHDRWEALAEVDAYPGRLVHTNLRLGYLLP
jgi:hypothetical protein